MEDGSSRTDYIDNLVMFLHNQSVSDQPQSREDIMKLSAVIVMTK